MLAPLDENGKPVDWWFIYKVPAMAKSASASSTTGYEYVYYDPQVGALKPSVHTLDKNEGALKLTLNALFTGATATTGWILYNDEMPPGAGHSDNGAFGHTKGIIGFDVESKTAFWLLHSWPKYADPQGHVGMPTPEYGQTFLCVSLDLDTAMKVAAQMAHYQQPQVYLPRMPHGLPNDSALYLLSRPIDVSAPGDSDVGEFTTRLGGMHFKVIAKNRKWGKDFWNDLVGPSLKSDMDVETWIRGTVPPMQDSDGLHKTLDIKFIDLRPLGATWAWPESKDHAKWGITYDNNWVCVGDINRMVSQRQRGGGTIALQDPKLWAALRQTDLLVVPKGHTKREALAMVQATHGPPPVVRAPLMAANANTGSVPSRTRRFDRGEIRFQVTE